MGPGAAAADPSCPNEALRTGASASLPDCRAYELVSPPNTGGIIPAAANLANTPHAFESPQISPDGRTVVFQSTQGALTGTEGSGINDRYLASRGPDGWSTQPIGPTARQTEQPWPGGITAQHDYYFLHAGGVCGFLGTVDQGSLISEFGEGEPCVDLLRKPDGSYEPIAEGSLGDDPRSEGFLITPGATHVIFDTSRGGDEAIQLEPSAPETGTVAIYDRTPGGPTRVVSLLPSGTPAAGQNAAYQGAAADGTVVAFKFISNGVFEAPLYVRVDNAHTYEVTAAENTFAGISQDGAQVFYANAASEETALQTPADLFSFDTTTQTTTQITNVGDAQFVNVSADGSRVYFVSPSQIGGQGLVGEPNLYVWDRGSGTTTFIATVDPGDLSGAGYSSYPFPPSLAGWTEFATGHKNEQFGAGANLSRTTPDGSAIVFESRAKLTGFENEGHSEIYRYDAIERSLTCVSCGPGPGPAVADASLQSFRVGAEDHARPLTAVQPSVNLSEDGNMVFFQTGQALVPADVNGRQDVYEWETDGTGNCREAAGCTSLISSGGASRDSFLYSATGDGSDVVLLTPQPLVPEDENGATGALYDARIDGGFPASESGGVPCAEDSCQGLPTPPPAQLAPGSTGFSGHVARPRSRKCRRHGKAGHVKARRARCRGGRHPRHEGRHRGAGQPAHSGKGGR